MNKCDVDGCESDAYAFVWPVGGDQLRARCFDCFEFDKADGRLAPLDPDA